MNASTLTGRKAAERPGRRGPTRRRSTVCPHSASCFTCPKPDCVAGGRFSYNEILDEDLYFDLIGKYTG